MIQKKRLYFFSYMTDRRAMHLISNLILSTKFLVGRYKHYSFAVFLLIYDNVPLRLFAQQNNPDVYMYVWLGNQYLIEFISKYLPSVSSTQVPGSLLRQDLSLTLGLLHIPCVSPFRPVLASLYTSLLTVCISNCINVYNSLLNVCTRHIWPNGLLTNL